MVQRKKMRREREWKGREEEGVREGKRGEGESTHG